MPHGVLKCFIQYESHIHDITFKIRRFKDESHNWLQTSELM